MITHKLQIQARKIEDLHGLCLEVSRLNDTRILGNITRYYAILTASYVEFSLQEVVRSYVEMRSSKIISSVVTSFVERQNSIDCRKIRIVLDSFDKRLYPSFESRIGPDRVEAINSLKNLRDSLAHGNDNGTSYIKIKDYYDKIVDIPHILDAVLSEAQ